MYHLPHCLINAVKTFLLGGVGAGIWKADCNRSLVAIFSLEKRLFFEHERTHSFHLALQSHLEEVPLLMFRDSKEKRSHQLGEGLLLPLR